MTVDGVSPRMLWSDRLRSNRRAEQTIGMPADTRRWSAAEVRELQDESRAWPRYELIAGELLVTPAPGYVHQIAVSEILMLLSIYVDGERLGVTLASPADLELHPGTVAQPDVFVVPPGRRTGKESSRGWSAVRSLRLAIEVISPSSVRTDRTKKRNYYLSAGVPEYWVVDVNARVVERWSPGLETPARLRDTLEWRPAGAGNPLVVDLPALFERIWQKFRTIDGA
jgi:Uma2 family endonuclease